MNVDLFSRRMSQATACLLILCSTFSSTSAKNNPAPAQENRFLLIVETSRETSKRSAGIAGTLDKLVRSGMQKQIRPGDSIGVWTYNDTLKAGEFPLQTWSPDAAQHISSGVLAYVGAQKFAKSPQFSVVSGALNSIVKHSAYLTVVIICSGTHPIAGTPFDNQIQKAFRSWRDEQQKADMPYVVVLRTAHGEYTHFAVTPAPWQIEMPPFPAELVQSQEMRGHETAVSSQPKPLIAKTYTVAPLIVSGKHRDPQSNITAAATAPTANNAAPVLTPTLPAPRLETNLSHESRAAGAASSNRNTAASLAASQAAALVPDVPAGMTKPGGEQILKDASTLQSNRSATVDGISGTNRIADATPSASPAPRIDPAPALALPVASGTSVFFRRLILLVAVLSAAGGIFLVRRSHPGHVSLITHSIDRERE